MTAVAVVVESVEENWHEPPDGGERVRGWIVRFHAVDGGRRGAGYYLDYTERPAGGDTITVEIADV